MRATGMLVMLLAWSLAGCGEETTMNDASKTSTGTGALDDAARQTLAGQRYFFGHQSVGNNILAGIGDFETQHPDLGLKIVKNPDPAAMQPGTLGHAPIGTNNDPEGKIADFVAKLEGGLASQVDVAFMKFCYLDFGPDTDVDAIFARYRDTMSRLREAYPGLTIVHFTVPLRPLQKGPKALVKALMGRPITGREDNVTKNRYNDLVREHYEGREPVFDIAAIESTRPDRTRETFEYEGQKYFALVQAYSPDDGHLNEAGRTIVATRLLEFLGQL